MMAFQDFRMYFDHRLVKNNLAVKTPWNPKSNKTTAISLAMPSPSMSKVFISIPCTFGPLMKQ